MRGNPFLGAQYFFQGFHWIFTPGLKRYILVPIIVNIFLLIGIFAGMAMYIVSRLPELLHSYPQWLILILGWLFWILYIVISLLIGTLFFTMLTNLIASPFYGILAEAMEEKLEGKIQRNFTFADVLKIWWQTFIRECRKLVYFIPWLLFTLLFVILPLTWILFPFVWWLVMSWIMAIQYSDYAADNQQVPFKEMLAMMKKESLTVLGFGGIVSLAMTVPILNLFVPAAAVVGGTILWYNLKNKNSDMNLNVKKITY